MKISNRLLCAAIAAESLSLSAQDKPNIILIMTDQQSYNAVGALAGQYPGSYFETPNIDRIVNDGTSFTRTYCSNPVSVASRFALFTGMYGGQYGVRDNKCEGADETTVRAMLATNGMGGVFERGGYDTYYGGKVHLPFSGKTGSGHFAAPKGYGFTTYYTDNERDVLGQEGAALIDSKGEALSNGTLDKPFLMIASFINPHDICLEGATNVSDTVVDRNENKTDVTECVKAMRALADAIPEEEFYRDYAPLLPTNFARTEDVVSAKDISYCDFPENYWRRYRWIYGQMVKLVDSHIGDILDALDRWPALKENTVVIFTSDHGEMQGAHQLVTKGVPYDECQRVPLIFSGKGIDKGVCDHTLVCNGTDLLPTLCDIAGIAKPECDGVSLYDHLYNGSSTPLHDRVYLEGESFVGVITDDYKYSKFDLQGGGEMLIDLSNDPGELTNIIAAHMDIATDLTESLIPTDTLKLFTADNCGLDKDTQITETTKFYSGFLKVYGTVENPVSISRSVQTIDSVKYKLSFGFNGAAVVDSDARSNVLTVDVNGPCEITAYVTHGSNKTDGTQKPRVFGIWENNTAQPVRSRTSATQLGEISVESASMASGTFSHTGDAATISFGPISDKTMYLNLIKITYPDSEITLYISPENDLQQPSSADDSVYYDAYGRIVDKDSKGIIIIHNGTKMINR